MLVSSPCLLSADAPGISYEPLAFGLYRLYKGLVYWLAVKEPKLSYHKSKTTLFSTSPHYGTLTATQYKGNLVIRRRLTARPNEPPIHLPGFFGLMSDRVRVDL